VEVHQRLISLAGYAERLHALAGDGHHVVSPLGAWMVVALCGTLATAETRDELADVLGADPTAAAEFAAELLADPHPLVAAGAGVWIREGYETTLIERWREALPDVVETGDIPTQAELDQWAAERSFGMIDSFPIELSADVACLLASALATRVSWEVPFDVVDATALNPTPWSSRLQRVLRSPAGDPRHRQFLLDTDRAGRVAVHMASARRGLLVGSVIAADPAVAAGDVLAVAERIVATEALEPRQQRGLSLFELPLGEGPIWSITEQLVATKQGLEEEFVSVLPAWSAETDIDLGGDRTLGFPVAARTLAEALQLGECPYDAQQRAVARYNAVGFEAAAVTGLAVLLSGRPPTPGRRRTATIRFAHPFGVVAATTEDYYTYPPDPAGRSWHGLPVFSAWISEPSDA
jgi:hypothetical protein